MRALCWTALLAAVAAAQAPVKLEIKLGKGKRWTVSQTVALKSDCTDAAGVSVGPDSGNPETTVTEVWTDECLSEESGRPSQLRLTYSESNIRAEHAGDDTTEDTRLKDAQVKLVRGAKSSQVVAEKGGPDKRTISMLSGAPVEAVASLLPAKAVKSGDVWDIPEMQAYGLMEALVAALPSYSDKQSQSGVGTLTQRMGVQGSSFCAPGTLKAKLASIDDGIATIEISGKKDIPGDPQKKGMGTCTVAGSLKLDTKSGAPVSFDLSVTQATGPSGAWARFNNGVKEDVGVTDEWHFKRTWEPAK